MFGSEDNLIRVDMSEFMTKTDFEPYKKIISEMQSVAEELKG